jgi:hypothetical protein
VNRDGLEGDHEHRQDQRQHRLAAPPAQPRQRVAGEGVHQQPQADDEPVDDQRTGQVQAERHALEHRAVVVQADRVREEGAQGAGLGEHQGIRLQAADQHEQHRRHEQQREDQQQGVGESGAQACPAVHEISPRWRSSRRWTSAIPRITRKWCR